MKKLTTVILLTGLVLTSFGQKKLKYEDVLPAILNLPSAGKPIILKEYKDEDPENVSIDFQLAVVYLERYITSDILTEFNYKYGNADKALTYLLRAQSEIDEKEIKKNADLYINFGYRDERGKPVVSYDTINNLMLTYIPELEGFVQNASGIYEKFTKSFSHYDRAHKIYTELVGTYQTHNDLLLLFNDEMDAKFEQMKTEYSNALAAFEEYKGLTDAYPINYNQELKISPIDVYRLDGLSSEINFLAEDVEIWNYSDWVDATRAYRQTNVDGLRAELEDEDKRLDQVLAATTNDFIREEYEPLDVSKELLFTLRKFDLRSVIESIFLYKEVKHNLMYQELVSKSLDTASTIDPERKLYLWGQMIKEINDADTLLGNIRARNNAVNHAKYGDLLQRRYLGESGINSFVQDERSTNKEDFDYNVSQIRRSLIAELNPYETDEPTTFKGSSYPLEAGLPIDDINLSSDPYTTHKIENFDNSAYIAGIRRNPDGVIQSYVAGVTQTGKIGWLNEYALLPDLAQVPSNTRIGAMELVPGGVVVVMNTLNEETGEQFNQLVKLSGAGEEELVKVLEIPEYPRTVNFVERSNSILISFKGEGYDDQITKVSEMTIGSYSILGDLLWVRKYEGKNDIEAVAELSDGYIIIGNYNQLTGLDGKVLRTGSTGTRSFYLKTDHNGDPIKLKVMADATDHTITDFRRVSDNCLNFFGVRGAYDPHASVSNSGQLVHVIMDKDLNELSNSLND